jgi:hypothetical protein
MYYFTGAVPLTTRHPISIADVSVLQVNAILTRLAEMKQSVKPYSFPA